MRLVNSSPARHVPSIARRRLLKGLATATLASALPRPAIASTRSGLAFGLTPVFRNSDLDLLDRLRAYLEQATGLPVELVSRRTYQEITALVVSGQVDAAWICGYPFVQYADELSLVAVPLWRRQPRYQSYLIVDRNRRGADWRMLRGDVHALSDPDSNSGYLVTAALLAEAGESVGSFFRSSFYTYGHRNVVRAVASGLAGSGSVDGYVWEVMQELEPDLTGQTRILRASEWLGFPPIAAAKAAAGSAATLLLRDALLAMATDPLGRDVLSMLRLDGFTAATTDLYAGIAGMVGQLPRPT